VHVRGWSFSRCPNLTAASSATRRNCTSTVDSLMAYCARVHRDARTIRYASYGVEHLAERAALLEIAGHVLKALSVARISMPYVAPVDRRSSRRDHGRRNPDKDRVSDATAEMPPQ